MRVRFSYFSGLAALLEGDSHSRVQSHPRQAVANALHGVDCFYLIGIQDQLQRLQYCV